MTSTTPSVSEPEATPSELIYPLDSRPPFGTSLLAAVQHILAMILSVIAPPLIVAAGLGLPAEMTSYLVTMALLFTGIGILLQVNSPWGIGSGLLTVQSTNFYFAAPLIAAGTMLMQQKGLSVEQSLSTLLGVCCAGGFIIMLGSRMMHFLRNVISHTVAGVTVMLIGISLIKVGAMDWAGGFAAQSAGTLGEPANLLLGVLVICIVVLCNRSQNGLVRMCSLVIGIGIGCLVAACFGMVDWTPVQNFHWTFDLPVPFKFGFFHFDWQIFFTLIFLFLVVVIESMGDITATSVVSEQPISGALFHKRLAGGILCDGLITSVGAVFGSLPMATFSQNNGIIQLSGVASRKVGNFCGALFLLFAFCPFIVLFFQAIPRPVLGGALIVLFGTIACSGIRILLQHDVNRRESTIIAISLGVGIMSMVTPEAFAKLPNWARMFLDSSIVSGGVTAILINQLLPKK